MILAKVVLKRIVSRYVFLQYMSPFLFKVIFQLFYVTDLYEFIYFLIFYCLEKIQVPYHKDLNFQLFSQKIFNFNLYMQSGLHFPLQYFRCLILSYSPLSDVQHSVFPLAIWGWLQNMSVNRFNQFWKRHHRVEHVYFGIVLLVKCFFLHQSSSSKFQFNTKNSLFNKSNQFSKCSKCFMTKLYLSFTYSDVNS